MTHERIRSDVHKEKNSPERAAITRELPRQPTRECQCTVEATAEDANAKSEQQLILRMPNAADDSTTST
jgi:hypothetical protein